MLELLASDLANHLSDFVNSHQQRRCVLATLLERFVNSLPLSMFETCQTSHLYELAGRIARSVSSHRRSTSATKQTNHLRKLDLKLLAYISVRSHLMEDFGRLSSRASS